jgi:hypothetical protein
MQAQGLFMRKGLRKKYVSRVIVASVRERQKNGTFKPKVKTPEQIE